MARAIDEFVAAWEALSGQNSGKKGGWRVIPVTSVGECKLHAARSFPGNEEALLVCFPTMRISNSVRLPEGNGFEVATADPHLDGKTWIALSRKSSGSVDLFVEMVADIAGAMDAESLSGEEPVFRAMLRRVHMWQQFMGKGAQPLGPEAELGLVGELALLEMLLDVGVDTYTALEGWLGPDDAPQDFVFGCGAIEVKSTLAATGFSAKIGSLEQLDDAVLSPLYLAAARFSKGEKAGRTLSDVVSELESRLSSIPGAAEFMKDRVFVAGYHKAHAARYVRRYVLEKILIYEVCDDFPRLTKGSVPDGVNKTAYEIDLNRVSGLEKILDVVLKTLGVVN